MPYDNRYDGGRFNRRRFIQLSVAGVSSMLIAPATALAAVQNQGESAARPFWMSEIRAITFDMQGTLVDFYSTIVQAGNRMSQRKGVPAQWGSLVDEWRQLYRLGLDNVISGKRAWVTTDVIYREALDLLLKKYNWGSSFSPTDRDELNDVWRHLRSWDDTVPGLTKLREKYTLSTLSNGSMSSVISIAKSGKLPFDCILTAELVKSAKPDPRVYNLAVTSLGLAPGNILMVACHKYDLKAAKNQGFRVAFIPRPQEFGPNGKVDLSSEPYFDIMANSVIDLGGKLGAA
jgi:2-haloacid dehalogenase